VKSPVAGLEHGVNPQPRAAACQMGLEGPQPEGVGARLVDRGDASAEVVLAPGGDGGDVVIERWSGQAGQGQTGGLAKDSVRHAALVTVELAPRRVGRVGGDAGHFEDFRVDHDDVAADPREKGRVVGASGVEVEAGRMALLLQARLVVAPGPHPGAGGGGGGLFGQAGLDVPDGADVGILAVDLQPARSMGDEVRGERR